MEIFHKSINEYVYVILSVWTKLHIMITYNI